MTTHAMHPDEALHSPAHWRDYLKMARLDHMTKHVFIRG